MISKAPAAKTALLTMLAAAPTLTGVRVRWGSPTSDDDMAGEHIWFGDTTDTQDHRGIGGSSRTDEFALTLIVRAYRAGNDPQAAETRCWELVGAVQDVIDADRHLGGVLNNAADVTETTVSTAPDPKGWDSRAAMTVRGLAVLVP